MRKLYSSAAAQTSFYLPNQATFPKKSPGTKRILCSSSDHWIPPRLRGEILLFPITAIPAMLRDYGDLF